MLFSVIISTFNRAALLARTLESVWRQTFTDYEVIVVDDGSTDNTQDYLRTLGGRVRVFKQVNRGPGAARNLGASHAQGEYLAFLDSDDLWFPWTLAVFADQIARHQKPAILAGRLTLFAEESELSVVTIAPTRVEAFADYLASSRRDYFVGAGMSVLRRDCFLESGGFVERRFNAEDHDLILRMGTAPGFVQVLDPVTLAWRRHASSFSLDLSRSLEGQLDLLASECQGRYPGGAARRRERWRILTKHARPVALNCLRQGMPDEAWKLYRATFHWHLALGRWKYLIGFPVKMILAR